MMEYLPLIVFLIMFAGMFVLRMPIPTGMIVALRAFLHFDILRGWGPMNYAGNADARNTKCIPYRTVTDNGNIFNT